MILKTIRISKIRALKIFSGILFLEGYTLYVVCIEIFTTIYWGVSSKNYPMNWGLFCWHNHWTKLHPCLVTDWVLGQFGSERKIAEAGYRRFVRDGIGVESIWNSVRAQSVLGEGDFIESLSDYVRGRKQIPEIAKSQRFINKPPLRDIFRSHRSRGTLLTIFTNIFVASLNHDIIVLCHDRRDWMHPERFIM
jgi:hypothetical protein